MTQWKYFSNINFKYRKQFLKKTEREKKTFISNVFINLFLFYYKIKKIIYDNETQIIN